jgi:RNA polymerase sigma factor (sigma-70 family)
MTGLNRWLSEVFRRYNAELVRYAARLVGSRDNGEEIVQDTYLRIAGRDPDAAVIAYPKTYLYTAARNAAVDFNLRRSTEWSYRTDVEDISVLADTADLDAAIERRQRIARLSVVLNELPRACRHTFILNKVEGRGHKEIAAMLGISVSMVEKHMMRAMVHCRDRLRDDEIA